MIINWENYRNQDGEIDLVSVYIDIDTRPMRSFKKAADFLLEVMDLSPVRSPQAAAIALAYALQMEA